jgi:hypothetical protein
MRICSRCSYVGKPVLIKEGNVFLEILLWLLIVVPGVFYTAWRQSCRYYGCPNCKAKKMAPVNSLRGKELMRKKERATKIEVIKFDR